MSFDPGLVRQFDQNPFDPVQTTTIPQGINQNPYYLPPINVVQTWNTKRLLPNILLSQYTTFQMLFLIDDNATGFSSRQSQDLNDSFVFGGPTDPILQLDKDYYSDPSQYQVFASPQGNIIGPPNSNNLLQTTKYLASSLQDGTFRLGQTGGIKAKILGYCDDDIVNLIPLTVKYSQLATPEMKGIFEMTNLRLDVEYMRGYIQGTIDLECHDLNQIFSYKSVVSQIFQDYSRYLVMFGWQGPSVENVDLTSLSQELGTTPIISGSNSLTITLLDGSQYQLNLPSPLVHTNGNLNLPWDTTNNCYIFDIDDIDNGNRMFLPMYGIVPDMKVEYPKIKINMTMSNASAGIHLQQNMAILLGGTAMDATRAPIIAELNKLKPIGFYNIGEFYPTITDADGQQAFMETFYNSIAAYSSAADLLKNPEGDNTTTVPSSTLSNQGAGSTSTFPAAYRLGDVITICLEVLDQLIGEKFSDPFIAIQDVVRKLLGYKVDSHNVLLLKNADPDGNDIDIEKLKPEQVYVNGQIQQNFLTAVHQLAPNLNLNDPNSVQNFLTNNCLSSIAKAIGFVRVSQGGNPLDDQGNKFVLFKDHFKSMNSGTKAGEVETMLSKIQKNNLIGKDLKEKIFIWDKDYDASFSGQVDPITVGDLPVSVDTLSRILQGMTFTLSGEDLLNQILTAVSLDYGFSLRVFHRTPGSTSDQFKSGEVQVDYANKRSALYDPSKVVDDATVKKINLIIDDEFLTQTNLAKTITDTLDNLKSPLVKSDTNVANQWKVITPAIQNKETIFGDSISGSLNLQQTIMNQEYSQSKLNSAFILDAMSNLSVNGPITFRKMEGMQYDKIHQIVVQGMYNIIKGNDMISPMAIPDDRKEIAHNFSSINNQITKQLMTKYNLMPGQGDFEIKYLNTITHLYDKVVDQNQTTTDQSNSILSGMNQSVDDLNQSFVNAKLSNEERRKFMASLIATYLYNRPMGVKFAFYLGQANTSLHGISGLGFYQGVYVRGVAEQNDGIYGLDKISHTISGGGSWKTDVDMTFLASYTQNQANALYARIADNAINK